MDHSFVFDGDKMYVTAFKLETVNWHNSGTDNEFSKTFLISKADNTITLVVHNGKGEKVYKKLIKLLPNELSAMCGFIGIIDDLHWQNEKYISEECENIVWQMTITNENHERHIIGNSAFPVEWEKIIRFSSSSFSNKEDGFELRNFFGFIFNHERVNL